MGGKKSGYLAGVYLPWGTTRSWKLEKEGNYVPRVVKVPVVQSEQVCLT